MKMAKCSDSVCRFGDLLAGSWENVQENRGNADFLCAEFDTAEFHALASHVMSQDTLIQRLIALDWKESESQSKN